MGRWACRLAGLYVLIGHRANKAFKRDSQRLAVLVQSLTFVFMAQWFSWGGGVVHPLTRR